MIGRFCSAPAGSFVATSTTRSTDGRRRNFSFFAATSSGVAAIDSANHALRLVLSNSLCSSSTRLQAHRLQMQQIVVVAEVVHADGGDGRHGGRGQEHQPRIGEQRRQPKTQIQRGRQVLLHAVGVGQADHRRQDRGLGQPAEQDPAAGNHSQLRHAGKLGQPGGEEGDGRGQRPGQNARPCQDGRLHQCLAGRNRVGPLLQVAGDVIDAVIDAQAEQDRREGDAENVHVTDGERNVTAGPNHGHHQRRHRQDRVPEAAEGHDHHGQHAQERDERCQRHRALARLHLVILDDRQAGQSDFQGRDILAPTSAISCCRAVDRLVVLGKALPVFFFQSQQDEAHPTVVRDQPRRGRFVGGRDRESHVRPGRLVGIGLGQRGGDSLHDARQLGLQSGQDFLPPRRRSAGHFRAHPAGHPAKVQLRPIALQDGASLVEKTVNLVQLFQLEIVEALAPQLGGVGLVHHRGEQIAAPGQLADERRRGREQSAPGSPPLPPRQRLLCR